jgi:hypothetical protein
MMAARVDPRAMVVHLDDGCIPFGLNCAEGTAALDPSGDARSLRLLSWSEKCALARFAGAGAEFIEQQFLAVCTEGKADGDPPRREALAALAHWLNAPSGHALPLDADLLAEVTVRVCEALALSPSELGMMSAADVEALSRGAATLLEASTEDWDLAGPDRILIRPDPRDDEGGPILPGDTPTKAVSPAMPAGDSAPTPSLRRARGTEAGPKSKGAVLAFRRSAKAKEPRFRLAVAGSAEPPNCPEPSVPEALPPPSSTTAQATNDDRPGETPSSVAPSQRAEAERGIRRAAAARRALDSSEDVGNGRAKICVPETAARRRPAGVARREARVTAPSGHRTTPAAAIGAASDEVIAARIRPLVDAVMQSPEPREPLPTVDEIVDEFAQRLATAAAECGAPGAE